MLWRSRHQSAACPNLPLPQINGSLARAAIKELLGKGLIKEVAKSRAQQVRSMGTAQQLYRCRAWRMVHAACTAGLAADALAIAAA